MNKRVLIVDYNHLAHTYLNSNYRLSKTIEFNGETKVIDTTVQTGTIKAIHRWSNHGSFPTAVCFDSPVPARKAYFAKNFGMAVDGEKGYKSGRKYMSSDMADAITMTKDILIASGVSCYKGHNYEADDLVFACIQKAKEDYPGVPIDVVTNDADLLPLVDDVVSVFLRSRVSTWAESKELEKPHYIQVTPKNYQEVVEGLSAYRKFSIPYNSILLHKLLRGDSSDNIAGVKKKFPPRVYNKLIEELVESEVPLDSLFRYGKCKERYYSIKTGEEVDAGHDKEDLRIEYDDPDELTDMVDRLCWYPGVDDETVDHILKMYRGMNLNQAYAGLGSISRKPARVVKPILPFNEGELQRHVLHLDINLKMKY